MSDPTVEGKMRMSPPMLDDLPADELITVLKALSEPNRLRIFAELMRGDSCNCELGDSLGLPPNLLSHHLRILSEADLVVSRRDSIDGRWIYYSVNRAAAARWQAWFTRFLDPQSIQERAVCGPEGQFVEMGQLTLETDAPGKKC